MGLLLVFWVGSFFRCGLESQLAGSNRGSGTGDVFQGLGRSTGVGRSFFAYFFFSRFIHLYIPWVPGMGVWLSILWLWGESESCFFMVSSERVCRMCIVYWDSGKGLCQVYYWVYSIETFPTPADDRCLLCGNESLSMFEAQSWWWSGVHVTCHFGQGLENRAVRDPQLMTESDLPSQAFVLTADPLTELQELSFQPGSCRASNISAFLNTTRASQQLLALLAITSSCSR
jgi:hypothetical protein